MPLVNAALTTQFVVTEVYSVLIAAFALSFFIHVLNNVLFLCLGLWILR
jgi:hypothetical protein